ncbi:uncharacterized protein LOC143193950 isoform X2 [Rhynchophorus ferrugineus]|uniref:uncharacterized protein LOC143193950 isoform X2 n=1 Tax=Rhynchophorus ferrugineus TaxID=354439 RepID=UPI003FCE8385
MSNSKSLAIHNLFVFIRVSSEMIFSHIFVVFFSLAVPLFDVDGQQHSNPNENIKHQSYNFMYDLSNGVKRKETVEWNEGSKDGLNIYGSYEYAVGETLVQVIDPYQIITRCFGYIIRRWIRLIELMNKNNP